MIRFLPLALCVWMSLPATAAEPSSLISIADLRLKAPPLPGLYETTATSFTMPSSVPRNAEVTCHVLRPTDETPRRDDLVLYLQHPQEQIWKSELFERLARESGFTVCGLFFAGMGKTEVDLYGDKANSYLWPESGSVTALMAAVAEVRKRHGLPPRPILVIGNSGGGTLAQHVAATATGVDGGVSLGGCVFLATARFRMPFLILNTLGDETAEHANSIAAFRYVLMEPVLRLESFPDWGRRGKDGQLFHHCISQGAFRLALRYLEGLADLRRDRGHMPRSGQWPFAADPAQPARLVTTVYPEWRGDLDSPTPVMLPSAATALAWLDLPRPPRQDHPLPRAISTAPAATRPAEAVAIIGWTDTRPDPDLAHRLVSLAAWDTAQAADAGLHGLWSAQADTRPGDLLNAAVRQHPPLKDLPVLIILHEPTAAELSTASRVRGAAALVVIIRRAQSPSWVGAIRKLAAAGLPIDIVAFGPKAAFAASTKDLTAADGITWQLHDVAGKRPSWEHALSLDLLIRQHRRLAAKPRAF